MSPWGLGEGSILSPQDLLSGGVRECGSVGRKDQLSALGVPDGRAETSALYET